MAQLREVNKTLIGVVKQLESMRSTYRSLHKYEMPVGNPIETDIKKILRVVKKVNLGKQKINLGTLANLSEKCIREIGRDNSIIAYKNIPVGKSKKGSSVNEGEVFGGDTRRLYVRMNNNDGENR
jgi:hypothetical protein